MKLDRRHMIVSIVLLVGSVIYNVYVFWGPKAASPASVASSAAPLERAAAAGGPTASEGGPVDPAQVKALPDVEFDRLPEWPRDPFLSQRLPDGPEVVEAAASAEGPVADPNPVVSTILYSPTRKRAVVDGRIVGVGDRVGSATVADITPSAVIIDSPVKGRLVLEVRPPGGALVGR